MSKFAELASSMQFVMDDAQTTISKKISNYSKLKIELEKLHNDSIVNYKGGLFKADPFMITMTLGFVNHKEAIYPKIILDLYKAPIVIENPAEMIEFSNNLSATYDAALVKYAEKHKLLTRR